MCGVVSFILALNFLISGTSHAREGAPDWSKVVIELENQEGQNFEQDLILARAYLHLQRRDDAQGLILKWLHTRHRKDPRLNELYETASDQFFFQESAEAYALAVQFIRESNWSEAKDKIESAQSKEKRHRLLALRMIQLALTLESKTGVQELITSAEVGFPDSVYLKLYKGWSESIRGNAKEARRILSTISTEDRAEMNGSEFFHLLQAMSIEVMKKSELNEFSQKIKRHPEWISLRLWRLKNKSFSVLERTKEIALIQKVLDDSKKTASLWDAEDKKYHYFFNGLIRRDRYVSQLEELMK